MLKINEITEISAANKIIKKTFLRGLQTIKSISAYNHNKLYFRSWRIEEHKHTRKLSQTYKDAVPVKNSQSVLDFYA